MPFNRLPPSNFNLPSVPPSTAANTQSSNTTELSASSTDTGLGLAGLLLGSSSRRSLLSLGSNSVPSKMLQQALKFEESGDLNKLQALLRENPSLFTETDNRGNSLLTLSVKNPQSTQTILFLAQLLRPEAMAAIVNHKNHEGNTALTLALKTKKLETAEILLRESDLDLRLANNQGENALHLAANMTPEIVALLLHPSTQASSPEILNRRDRNGITPLSRAVRNENLEIVKTLLQHPDIDVNLPDNDMQTPFHMAAKWEPTIPTREKNEKKMYLLLALLHHPSIQPNLPNKSGDTPLHSVIKESPLLEPTVGNHWNWVTLLAKSPKINPNQRDAAGRTPLEFILKRTFIPEDISITISSLLMNPIIDPNLPDRDGRTPVWQAIEGSLKKAFANENEDMKTLEMAPFMTLANFSSKVDFNRQHDGETIIGHLLMLAPPEGTYDQTKWRCNRDDALKQLLENNQLQQHLDYNAQVIPGKTMIELAVTEEKTWLAQLLAQNPRVDLNVLAPLLQDPQKRHTVYQQLDLYDMSLPTSESDFDQMEAQTLAKWATYRNADGSESKLAANTNYRLGTLLGKEEHRRAAQTTAPSLNADNDACATLTLALEQCLRFGKADEIKKFAKTLLELPLRQPEHFSLNGTMVARRELQNWAAGQLLIERPTSVSSSALSSARAEELLRNDEMHEVRSEAANTITRHMRTHIAKEAYKELEAGELWTKCKAALVKAGKLQPSENLSAAQLSAMNIRALRQKLGRLTESEAALYDAFMQQKYFATHFTNQSLDKPSSHGKTLSLFSQDKLKKTGLVFTNSTGISMFNWSGDNKFVFFALECGEKPKKLESRYYGYTVYRVPFDSPVFQQTSWGGLDYSNVKLRPDRNPKKHFAGINAQEADTIKTLLRRQTRDLSQPEGYDDIFVGKDLIEGTALSAISRIRALTETLPSEAGKLPPLAERLLASKTDVEIDGLLNGIFRPMIRVPIQMITDAFGKWDDDALTPLQKERIQQQYRR